MSNDEKWRPLATLTTRVDGVKVQSGWFRSWTVDPGGPHERTLIGSLDSAVLVAVNVALTLHEDDKFGI